jgi:hypothetical protein
MFIFQKRKDLLEKMLYLTSIHRHQLPIFFCHAFQGQPL